MDPYLGRTELRDRSSFIQLQNAMQFQQAHMPPAQEEGVERFDEEP